MPLHVPGRLPRAVLRDVRAALLKRTCVGQGAGLKEEGFSVWTTKVPPKNIANSSSPNGKRMWGQGEKLPAGLNEEQFSVRTTVVPKIIAT